MDHVLDKSRGASSAFCTIALLYHQKKCRHCDTVVKSMYKKELTPKINMLFVGRCGCGIGLTVPAPKM